MTDKRPFTKAESKPVGDVVRGDIIAYRDFHSGEWQRGVVYNMVVKPDNREKIIGFKILPLHFIGYGKDVPDAKEGEVQKSVKKNGPLVEHAGGTPRKQQVIVNYDLRSVANIPKMTGRETVGDVWTVGSFYSSDYPRELAARFKELYLDGKLYAEGKLMDETTKIVLIPEEYFTKVRRENGNNRLSTLNLLRNNSSGGATLEDVARAQPVRHIKKEKPAPVHAAPAAKPVESVAEFKKASTVYDVDLRNLVTTLKMGGERSGLTALRGGVNDENDKNKPLIDPETGKRNLKLNTLRDAWDYLKKVSPDLNPAVIAKTIQQSTNMTLNGATKVTERFKTLVEKLDAIETVDGKPKSDDDVIAFLIEGDKLIVKGP